MQRDRLDGWMVQQIAHADLARDALLLLPARPARAPRAAAAASSSSSSSSPTTAGPLAAANADADADAAADASPRQRRLRLAGERSAAASHIADEQWRAQFGRRGAPLVEGERVDRTRALRGAPDADSAPPSPSPPLLWGLPREHVLAFIRQALLPASWADARRATDRDRAQRGADDDERPQSPPTKATPRELPRVAALPPATRRGTRAAHQRASPPAPPRAATPGPSETRIAKLLAELRADPAQLAAFLRDVERAQSSQRQQRTGASDKLRENRERAATPRSPRDREDRKKQGEARAARVRQQRECVVQREDARAAAVWAAYQRRVQPPEAARVPPSDEERARRALARRQRVWLAAAAFSAATAALHAQLMHARVLRQVARARSRSARVIQRLWRQWKWQNASRHTVLVYSWLRRCLWKLLFRARVARKRRCAALLQRFMVDNFSGSRETRNFNHMMARWRAKVIHAQRLGLAFVLCSRARALALSLSWDAADHERQRSERRRPPPGDGLERGGKRPSGSASPGAGSRAGSAARRVTFRPPRTAPAESPAAASPASPPAGSLDDRWSARRSSIVLQQLDAVDDRLAAMQQLVASVELPRLQQQPHAQRVIRVPKSIKTRLLNEHLAAARREYMRQLRAYREHVACASYAMEVKLDDARAIVQSSSHGRAASRGTAGAGASASALAPPVFKLFSRPEAMAALVRRGVALALDADPELKAAIERQDLRRAAVASRPSGRPSLAPSPPKKSLVLAGPSSPSPSRRAASP